MNNFDEFRQRIRTVTFGLLLTENVILIAVWIGLGGHAKLPIILISFAGAIIASLALTAFVSNIATRPLQALWQVILHLSPSEHGIAKPDLQKMAFGRELVTNLASQIYQLSDLATQAADQAKLESSDLGRNFVAQNLPLPLFVLDSGETIKFANEAAAQYVGIKSADMIGKNVYMVLDMSFPSESTFDTWLKDVKQKSATASSSWERVRLTIRDGHPERLFDLAAYYNRDNPDHNETMLALFDHTKQYSQDDQAVSFIALSVHELRTPLTLLRGYIEVFEDEIDTSANPELHDFMLKMRSQAEQLMAFVNNILNVARVDDDQLELHLQEADWTTILKQAIENISLRAKVRGIALQCSLTTGLPSVGVDQISIMEVINNLVDNAIKYSGKSTTIQISTHMTQDGMVETTIQDFGLGISTSVIPNLFTKFYRDHRNRAQVGGTGLGLYLSKAIVTAHGGNMWVRSQEGQGSTFGFTLQPYSRLAEDARTSGNQELVRGAHGWIKNHSLYRR